MTYIEWEGELLKCLKSLPESESNEIISYYREMYGDRRDAGLSDDEIVKNFGEPMLCAAKILMESASESEIGETKEEEIPKKCPKSEPQDKSVSQKSSKHCFKNVSFAKIVGWFFLAILIIIPAMSTAVSAISAVFAVAVTGGAMVVGGALSAIASPFAFFIDCSGLGVLALLGASLAVAGAGALLFTAFYYITKYSVISCIKIFKYFVMRGNK